MLIQRFYRFHQIQLAKKTEFICFLRGQAASNWTIAVLEILRQTKLEFDAWIRHQ